MKIDNIDKNDFTQLLEERDRYKGLFQDSPFGLLYFDNKSNVIDCNNVFQKIFGLTKDQCIGVNLFEKLNDKKLLSALDNMFKTGFGEYEDVYISVITGKKIPIKIILKIIVEQGKPPGGIAIVIDMSEKYKYEQQLNSTKTKYKTIFNSINDAVIIHDLDSGSLLECNDKACEMFQYSKDEMLTKTVSQLSENISPFTSEEILDIANKVITSGPQIFNWRAKKKDFTLFWIEVNMRVAEIENEQQVIFVARDITEQIKENELKDKLVKELENKASLLTELNNELKVKEAELLKLSENKDKFYSTVSHDLKSPFLSILGYTEFLDNNLEKLTSSEIKDSLVSLNLAISNVYVLIERLLEWSRTQSGEFYFDPKHLNLAKIFDYNIDILIKNANYKNIRIINDIAPDISVIADEYMLSSIIRNLLSNAIKFSYMNTKIVITSQFDGQYEKITIEDFGVGIDTDQVDNLFSIKNLKTSEGTSREVGVGLGLLLCKEWIEKNNGKLWIESEKNVGTRIYFTLPVTKIKNE